MPNVEDSRCCSTSSNWCARCEGCWMEDGAWRASACDPPSTILDSRSSTLIFPGKDWLSDTFGPLWYKRLLVLGEVGVGLLRHHRRTLEVLGRRRRRRLPFKPGRSPGVRAS